MCFFCIHNLVDMNVDTICPCSLLNLPFLQANYGQKSIEVITFGQPRIGNSAFATFYMDSVPATVRITHGHDVVPHLPPYYAILGQKTYHHFATEVY